MSTRRYALPVDDTHWCIAGHGDHTVFSWDYDEGRDKLLALYEQGKDRQWNAQRRLDWSIDVDVDDQSLVPDYQVPIFGSPTWERMSRPAKDEVRHHVAAWLFSQFLHGEQGALVCTAKIVQTVPDLDAKFYAATQVIDEARHVETYARYLHTKLDLAYPINPHLRALLDNTISDNRWDFTYLGMQMMIEGVALAAFGMVRDMTQEPLARALNAYVMSDEARHVAFGILALQDAYTDLSAVERAEREEFVVEASYLLRDRFLAEEVWDNLGLDVGECTGYVEHSPVLAEFRKQLFSRVVPSIKRIGLWGPKVQKAFEDMGVLGFGEVEPEEMFTLDQDLAAEIERAMDGACAAGMVAGAEPAPPGGPTGRSDEIAQAVIDGR